MQHQDSLLIFFAEDSALRKRTTATAEVDAWKCLLAIVLFPNSLGCNNRALSKKRLQRFLSGRGIALPATVFQSRNQCRSNHLIPDWTATSHAALLWFRSCMREYAALASHPGPFPIAGTSWGRGMLRPTAFSAAQVHPRVAQFPCGSFMGQLATTTPQSATPMI